MMALGALGHLGRMWQSQATPALGGAPFQEKQLNEEHWDHSVVYRMLTPLEMAMESERERESQREG